MNDWGFDAVLLLLIALGLGLLRLIRLDGGDQDLLSDGNLQDEGVQLSSSPLFPSRLIRQAGIVPRQLGRLYWPAKMLLAVVLPMAMTEVIDTPVATGWLVLMALPGFLMLDIGLLLRRAQRRRRIQASLSFLVDRIVAYLNSGYNLSQAFRQAARFGLTRGNPLAREVLLLAQELDLGRERLSAFQALAERTGVDDLRRLAAVMQVGLQVGSPVAPTLAVQAGLLRAKQLRLSTERINRKNAEALLPMLLVCLPMFAVLVLFPAALQFQAVLQLIRNLL